MSEREPEARPEQVYDVVIVGFGGAGACAAIAAADAGASVLVLDRFYGGGSTTHSGGVVYAGGGTTTQREAGVADSTEDMFAISPGRSVTRSAPRRCAGSWTAVPR